MAHSDPISDLLTRLRNGVSAKHRFIDLYSSRMILDVLRVLEKLGFIEHILVNEENRKTRVFLRYAEAREPVLQGLKRMSSPGLRRYVASRDIPKVHGGMGAAILSTPQGVLDGETARKQNVGGELLCLIW